MSRSKKWRMEWAFFLSENGRRGEELEKAQEHTERTQPEKKLSIRERLENARQECAKQKAPEIRKPGRDVPEHGNL